MFRNHIKLALKNISKHKFYAFLNIFGLAIGITSCIIVILFIQKEFSYDRYYEKADRIYRVQHKAKFGGTEKEFLSSQATLAEKAMSEIPGIESAVRLREKGNYTIRNGINVYKEEKAVYADPTLFEIFSLPLLKGDFKNALINPFSAVINKKTAVKYFGNENPIGKTFIVDNKNSYSITGVFDEIPENTHFNYDIFFSMSTLPESRNLSWLNTNFVTYFVLQKDASPNQITAQLALLNEKYLGPDLVKMGMSFSDLKKGGNYWNISLMPVTDIHLHSKLSYELGTNTDIKYIYIFIAVALFILIIAGINFINLSTALSSERAKEVGIRKVLGSFRKELMTQFLIEAVTLSFIALFISLVLCIITLPMVNSILDSNLTLFSIHSLYIFPTAVIITMLTGVLAGLYPSLFISSFQPVEILKGKLRTGLKSGRLRSSLVVFQFTISIVMIVGTIVIGKQLNFIRNKNLGFDKEQVLIINEAWALENREEAFKNELKNNKDIIDVTVTGFLPVPSIRTNDALFPNGDTHSPNATSMQNWNVDSDYIRTLGMTIVQGRDFSKDFISDSTCVILNESAIKVLKLNVNPIGEKLGKLKSNSGPMDIYTVIGVVKDFHFESIHNEIGGLALFLKGNNNEAAIRIKTENVAGAISFIKKKWNDFAPNQPFDFSFMNEDFNKVYINDQKVGEIFRIFATLSIITGCLGLLGLAAFTAGKRTKEIGIRKVMGASIPGIITLLCKEFAKLLLVAYIIAVPVSYYIMNNWLNDFAYKTSIDSSVFILAGLLVLFIAAATVIYHSVKAATANPVDSMKYE